MHFNILHSYLFLPHFQTMPFHILHSYLFLPHFQTMPFRILHPYSFLPHSQTMPFHILHSYSFLPHSQTMHFHILHSYSFLPHSQHMPFLLSAGLQYWYSAHHSNISAQLWAAFTHSIQYIHTLPINSEQLQAHINIVHNVDLHWQVVWDMINFK